MTAKFHCLFEKRNPRADPKEDAPARMVGRTVPVSAGSGHPAQPFSKIKNCPPVPDQKWTGFGSESPLRKRSQSIPPWETQPARTFLNVSVLFLYRFSFSAPFSFTRRVASPPPRSSGNREPPPVPDRKWTSFGSRTAQSGKTAPFLHRFRTTRRFRRGAIMPPSGKAASAGASRAPQRSKT